MQYVLNLQPENQSLCRRTIERYIKLFRDDAMAQTIMHDVTAELVQLSGQKNAVNHQIAFVRLLRKYSLQ